MSAEFSQWRSLLKDAETQKLIEFISSLKTTTTAERALKTREKFKDISTELLRLALETVEGRETLKDTPWTKDAFFLKQKLEQSTRPEIAAHHALEFKNTTLLEIGCGIGFDSTALAKEATHLTAIDSDPLACAITEHNLALQKINNVTIINLSFEEYRAAHALSQFNGCWADPGRRTESGERIYAPDLYQPPLHSLFDIEVSGPVGIKISPALNINNLPLSWSREFIGWEWGCLEQILWKNTKKNDLSASRIDSQSSWHSSHEKSAPPFEEELVQGNYLIEPHPALVRTSHLENYYAENDFYCFDEHRSLGISRKQPKESPWYRSYEIVEQTRFTLKDLKQLLHEKSWDSRTQIKKKGVHDDPDQVHRQLKLPSPSSQTSWGFVILTKRENSPVAILAKRAQL